VSCPGVRGVGGVPMTRPLPPLSKADKEHLANGSKWDLIQAVVIGVDQVVRDLEQTWGVGRLITLVSDKTRLSFKRGHGLWSQALTDSDLEAVRDLGPKMIAAWRFMAKEADSLGHAPLSVDRWEARMKDGRVLVVVRTVAEAHAVAADGRGAVCWTMDELARVLPSLTLLDAVKTEFPGAEVARVVMRAESYGEAWATDSWRLDLHEMEGV
jgi:hypothetical protein